jgi:hypothetical protein
MAVGRKRFILKRRSAHGTRAGAPPLCMNVLGWTPTYARHDSRVGCTHVDSPTTPAAHTRRCGSCPRFRLSVSRWHGCCINRSASRRSRLRSRFCSHAQTNRHPPQACRAQSRTPRAARRRSRPAPPRRTRTPRRQLVRPSGTDRPAAVLAASPRRRAALPSCRAALFAARAAREAGRAPCASSASAFRTPGDESAAAQARAQRRMVRVRRALNRPSPSGIEPDATIRRLIAFRRQCWHAGRDSGLMSA